MEKLNNYFTGIDESFKKTRILTIIAVVSATIIAISSVAFAFIMIERSKSQVYVIDRGSAAMAGLSNEHENKDLEVKDHVSRFHELLLNLSPSEESIKRNIDRALIMSDRSAYDYWMDLSERGFYQRLISANISQEVVIDSVKVDVWRYPYKAKTYGKLYLLRESNITSYDFESSCQLVEIQRSSNNPHGLMIEKFVVEKNDKIETRKRR